MILIIAFFIHLRDISVKYPGGHALTYITIYP
jgi:hypothetical protein